METNNMNENLSNKPGSSKTIHGLLLVLIGATYFLENMGVFPSIVRPFLHSWQIIIVFVGLFIISSRNYTGGIIVTLVGLLLMYSIAHRSFPDLFIELPRLSFHNIWPLGLIVLGAIFVLKSLFGKKKISCWKGEKKCTNHRGSHRTNEYSNMENTFNIDTAFNGTEHIILSHNFIGGEVNVLFGEARVDLQKVILSNNSAYVNANVLFGSIIILVPLDWNVSFDTSVLFGAAQDKRSSIPDYNLEKPVITIKGNCLFGSIELIN